MCKNWQDLCKELDIIPQSGFTAEKQLEIIELLSDYDFNSYSYRLTEDNELEYSLTLESSHVEGHGKTYGEALANLLMHIYPVILEAKQQALARILKK